MRRVLALIARELDIARISSVASGQRVLVTFCLTPGQLSKFAAAVQPDVVLFDLTDSSGRPILDTIRVLRSALPRIAFVACISLTSEEVHALPDLIRSGISGVLVRETDFSPAVLIPALERACRLRDEEAILAPVVEVVPASLSQFFRSAMLNSDQRVTVEATASQSGVHSRTVAAQLKRLKLPTAGRIIGWLRILSAIRMLEDAEVSLESVANRLGFPGASGLHHMLRRYFGTSRSGLAQAGGFEGALAMFRAELGSDDSRVQPAKSPVDMK